MAAMDKTTGKAIHDAEEIRQSVQEIIRTVPGDRVMRAEYGSELLNLTDVALNASGRARITQATAGAIAKWEPRLKMQRVVFTQQDAGSVVQEVQGTVVTTRENISIRTQ